MDRQNEQDLRKEALRLYLTGLPPREVYRQLHRTKPWFFKWLNRYQSGEANWYEDKSTAPHQVARKTPDPTERAVLETRSKLEKSKYAQTGALAIQWEMQKEGVTPPPTWTINRILKRHHAVREKQRYQPSGKAYPDVRRLFSESLQEADLVGPRYLKGQGRFYSLNVLDLETYLVAVNPCRSKSDEEVATGLLRTWKTIGKPDILQLDNELSFRGSNRYPHSLGLVPRLCLALGVQVLFIPISEPWRNGAVERFQDTFDKCFYRRQFFPDFTALKQQAECFEKFRNQNHRCTALGGKIPMQHVTSEGIPIRRLDASLKLKEVDLTLTDGYVHLVRFIRSDCLLNIFGEKFKVPKEVKYEYVIATICTKIHTLQVRLDQQLVTTFEYRIPILYEHE